LHGLGISMLACSAWALYLHPDFTSWGLETRFNGGTGNALIIGAFATVNSTLFFTLLFPEKVALIRIEKWKVWAFYLSSVFVVLATWSRMPMITVVLLSLLAVLTFATRWRGNIKRALLTIALVLTSCVVIFEQTSVGIRFKTAANEFTQFNENADQTTPVGVRMAMQKAAIDAVKKAPFFGSGAGSAMRVSKESSLAMYGPNASIQGFRHLHNQYLQVAVEQGLVGLGLFVLIGVFAVRYFWKTNSFFIQQAGISLVLAYALLGLTNFSVKQGALNSFLVLMLAMLVVLAERSSNELKSQERTV
jgi:O-antigen ligase